MIDDFWGTLDDEEAIPSQLRTAVYINVGGLVVIRQDIGNEGNEDPIILVQPENVQALIDALQKHLPAAREAPPRNG